MPRLGFPLTRWEFRSDKYRVQTQDMVGLVTRQSSVGQVPPMPHILHASYAPGLRFQWVKFNRQNSVGAMERIHAAQFSKLVDLLTFALSRLQQSCLSWGLVPDLT